MENIVGKDLDIVKEEIQKKFGDPGIQIYNESVEKMNITEDSSKNDVEKLISDIEVSLSKNADDSKTFNELRQKLDVYGKFSPIFRKFLSEKKIDKIKIDREEIEDKIKIDGIKIEELEFNLLELLYSRYDCDRISKDLNIKEEDLAEIFLSLDNKGLIKMEDKKWILTDSGRKILKLEGKTIELLSHGHNCNYISKVLNIKEEDLADIILSLDNKGLIKMEDKKWILTDNGKDIFEKRDNLLKHLKIDYLYGIKNKDEYNARKKELEEIPQLLRYGSAILGF